MEAASQQGTLSGKPLKDVGSGGSKLPDQEGAAAVSQVAQAEGAKDMEQVSEQTQQSALDWFVSSEPLGGPEGDYATVQVNVGGQTDDNKKLIDWVLRPIALDTLRAIRKRANSTREARQSGVTDEFRVNLEIVAACTVQPNLREAAQSMKNSGGDPAEALRIRFMTRPGLVQQLSGKILAISGFDDEDVQDKAQVKAAGNS